MKTNFLYLLSFVFFITACTGTSSETTTENNNPIIKDEPVVIEPQSIFDQSQMTNKLLALCVKFKTLNGHDRTAVFNLFEKVLPSCPFIRTANNEGETDPDNAVQVMSLNDLKELLGEPSEIRNDGMFVYNLAADGSYKVLFMPELNGAVACRFYEGNS